MSKKMLVVVSVLVLAAMVLSSCAPKAVAPGGKTYKFCEVTDVGGIDDKSFNALGWAGMEAMKNKYSNVEVKYLESQQQSDYEVNINAFIAEKCDLIVSVGFLLADATMAAAKANPDVNFAIIDNNTDPTITNLRGNYSNIAEATFLAGYLSAGMSTTGKVGTYVGILFPATQAFMDGYAMGVAKYNEVHGTAVEVLGWDMAAQEGLATGNFESTDDGRKMAETLMDEGADINMPVAGPVGIGSLAVMAERGSGLLIGVDQDWAVTQASSANFVLASALKKIDVFVVDSCEAVMNGTFKGGEDYALTLANGGVGLGISSTWESKIPADLKAEVEALIPQIIAGEIAVMPTR
ncbi:MAG: BMP family ABC transporter substrate-binding protein [Anaerolineaceae bacterium]|nr:BMP family ABC transporter substrate-binding protein [Anaerolineaceae bacterium]